MTAPAALCRAVVGLCFAVAPVAASAQTGSVQPLEDAAYRVETTAGPETVTLPRGLSVLRAKRSVFRYGVRVNETVVPRARAIAWTQEFCARFERTATRHTIAGGGPTGRNLKFNCQ